MRKKSWRIEDKDSREEDKLYDAGEISTRLHDCEIMKAKRILLKS